MITRASPRSWVGFLGPSRWTASVSRIIEACALVVRLSWHHLGDAQNWFGGVELCPPGYCRAASVLKTRRTLVRAHSNVSLLTELVAA
jgi:hypothetical protein